MSIDRERETEEQRAKQTTIARAWSGVALLCLLLLATLWAASNTNWFRIDDLQIIEHGNRTGNVYGSYHKP